MLVPVLCDSNHLKNYIKTFFSKLCTAPNASIFDLFPIRLILFQLVAFFSTARCKLNDTFCIKSGIKLFAPVYANLTHQQAFQKYKFVTATKGCSLIAISEVTISGKHLVHGRCNRYLTWNFQRWGNRNKTYLTSERYCRISGLWPNFQTGSKNNKVKIVDF